MILPDVNLLLHAYNRSPVHSAARVWWEGLLNGTRPVGLAWAVILGFVRICTHRQILDNPLPVRAACDTARAWLQQPYVSVLQPGDRHAEILRLANRLLRGVLRKHRQAELEETRPAKPRRRAPQLAFAFTRWPEYMGAR